MWIGFAALRRVPPDQGPLTDGEALALASAGDGRGLAALYDRYARAVYSLALRIVHIEAEAEDVVQDVFAQVFRQARRYDEARGTVIGWLLTITRTRAIDHVRARRRRGDEDGRRASDTAAANVADPRANQESQALTAEQIERVRRALEALSVDQRRAIQLAYYEGFSQSEIARHLSEPLGTIKSRIRAAMLRLRDALETESPAKAAKAP